MIREKSCGAVIFTRKDGQRLYLIEKMKHGHRSLCKGHVEPGETELETAAREIREETGLTVTFLGDFRESIRYSPYPGCSKTVVFFLAESAHDRTIPQESEVSEIFWLPLEEAMRSLSHKSDREILRKADQTASALEKGESAAVPRD